MTPREMEAEARGQAILTLFNSAMAGEHFRELQRHGDLSFSLREMGTSELLARAHIRTSERLDELLASGLGLTASFDALIAEGALQRVVDHSMVDQSAPR